MYAESLYEAYEAVLRGLNRLADVGWESAANETVKRVEVEIHQEPTRHIVELKWIEEKSMYPAQEARKAKLRKLLNTQWDQRLELSPHRSWVSVVQNVVQQIHRHPHHNQRNKQNNNG